MKPVLLSKIRDVVSRMLMDGRTFSSGDVLREMGLSTAEEWSSIAEGLRSLKDEMLANEFCDGSGVPTDYVKYSCIKMKSPDGNYCNVYHPSAVNPRDYEFPEIPEEAMHDTTSKVRITADGCIMLPPVIAAMMSAGVVIKMAMVNDKLVIAMQ